jgi:hypothetical protein
MAPAADQLTIMSCRALMLAALVALIVGPLAGMARADSTAWPSSAGSTSQPFSYDTLHPGADLNPKFVDPNALATPRGPLEGPPALTPHQDCIPYHQQMTRDLVYPYQSGPCLPGDQK